VTRAERGRAAAGGATLGVAAGSKTWSLDGLGNWTSVGSYDGSGLSVAEARVHNASNEIASIGGVLRKYDPSGNLREVGGASGDPVHEVYHYDAWNRLTRADHQVGPSSTLTRTYGYNALHWRVKETASGAGAGAAELPVVRRMYYSPAWQVLQELDSASAVSNDATRRQEQVWGLRGADDALLRTDYRPAAPVPKDAFYQLTDSSFSVVAHLDFYSGALRQRVSYDAYGTPRTILPGDFNGDGMVGGADKASFGDH